MSLLEVRSLVTRFKTETGIVCAVNDVTFSLERGETLGIVGESGSGKSATALSIMGLIGRAPGQHVEGEIRFEGTDLLRLPESRMRRIRGARIGMIFQDPMTALNPVLTVGDQIAESLRLHLGMSRSASRARTIELLDIVGISSPGRRVNDYPHQLSGGMRQRVMIAIALACNPDLLIADEPTTALDVTIQAQIIELLDRLKRELGTALMIITHDLGVVAGIADRVVVMYAGRTVESGPTDAIFADPRMPYTIGLLKSIPRLDALPGERLEPIPGQPPDVSGSIRACSFAPRCEFFVAGRCDREVPPLRPVGTGHGAACLFDVTAETVGRRVAPATAPFAVQGAQEG